MVNVRDDGDVTQNFRSQLTSGIEIARYCTRINRNWLNRITNILRKQVLQSLFGDRFHGALKGWFAFYCTNVVLNVH